MTTQTPVFLLALLLATASVPVSAQSTDNHLPSAAVQNAAVQNAAAQNAGTLSEGERIKQYAEKYAQAGQPAGRLALANDFFGYLYEIGFIGEPVVFPDGAHMDSVDLNVWFYLSDWYYNEGGYGPAVEYAMRAADYCTDRVDELSKSDVYSQLGNAWFHAGDYEKASRALLKSYEIDRKSGDYDRLSSTLNSIGCVFVAGGRAPEAEKYVMEGIAANALTDNLARRAVLYGTASEMYKAARDYPKALKYAEGALVITRETGDSAKTGIRLSQVANVHLGMGQVEEAKRLLAEAVPLLLNSGNLHSYGICRNQLGDIYASEGRLAEATNCYREAADIFLRQKDLRNELHSREGLYNVTKTSLPGEAMLHLERAKILQDSVYRLETGEALGRYNAIYYNDILKEKQLQAEHQKNVILVTSVSLALLVLAIIVIGITAAWRYHKRRQTNYENDITSLQGRYNEVNRHFHNLVQQKMKEAKNLTEDDRLFLGELIDAINAETEQGMASIDRIAGRMHITTATLRRRIAGTLKMTPMEYILQVRMRKARYLLENFRDITIAEVAERCGYTQIANFSRAFLKYYGVTPKEVKLKEVDSRKPEEENSRKPKVRNKKQNAES